MSNTQLRLPSEEKASLLNEFNELASKLTAIDLSVDSAKMTTENLILFITSVTKYITLIMSMQNEDSVMRIHDSLRYVGWINTNLTKMISGRIEADGTMIYDALANFYDKVELIVADLYEVDVSFRQMVKGIKLISQSNHEDSIRITQVNYLTYFSVSLSYAVMLWRLTKTDEQYKKCMTLNDHILNYLKDFSAEINSDNEKSFQHIRLFNALFKGLRDEMNGVVKPVSVVESKPSTVEKSAGLNPTVVKSALDVDTSEKKIELNINTMTKDNLISMIDRSLKLTNECLAYVVMWDRTSVLRVRGAFSDIEWFYLNFDKINARIALNFGYEAKNEVAGAFKPDITAQITEKLLKLDNTNRLSASAGVIDDESLLDIQTLLVMCYGIHCNAMVHQLAKECTLKNAQAGMKVVKEALDYLLLNAIDEDKSIEDDKHYRIQEYVKSKCKNYQKECSQVLSRFAANDAVKDLATQSHAIKHKSKKQKKSAKKLDQEVKVAVTSKDQKSVKVIADLKAQIAQAKAKQKKLSDQLKDAEEKQKNAQRKLHSAGAASVEKLQQLKNQFETDQNNWQKKNQELKASRQKIAAPKDQVFLKATAELEAEVKQITALNQESLKWQAEITQLTDDLSIGEAENKKIAEEITTLQKECDAIKDELSNGNNQSLKELKPEISSVDKAIKENMRALLTIQKELGTTLESIKHSSIAIAADQRAKAAKKDQIAELKTAIKSVKNTIKQQSVTDYTMIQARLKTKNIEAKQKISDASARMQAALAAQAINADHLGKQEVANTQLNHFLNNQREQLKAREQRLATVQAQLQARKTELSIRKQSAPVIQQPTVAKSPIISELVSMQSQSLAHDYFNRILSPLLSPYLQKYYHDNAMVFVIGNFINDLISAETGYAQAKLILDKTKPNLELPSCLMVPVESIIDFDYEYLQQLGVYMTPMPITSAENRNLYQVTNVDKQVSFYVKQELVSSSRMSLDIYRSVVAKAIFTKDRVILKISLIGYTRASAEIIYRDKKDLEAMKTNTLILVDDLQYKSPMLIFSMIADLLQLGDSVKITDITPLRSWVEQLWNIVDDEVTLCKVHNELVPLLLDQSKLKKALNIMYQCNILELMIFPYDPKSRLSADQFNNLNSKLIELQRQHLKLVLKSHAHDIRRESKELVGDHAESKMAAPSTMHYISQVYGHFIRAYYAHLLSYSQESELNNVLDKFKALFNNGSLNRDVVKEVLLSTQTQLTADAERSRKLGMFNKQSENSTPALTSVVTFGP